MSRELPSPFLGLDGGPAVGQPVERDMCAALEADGEKLRQLTGQDHGPAFVADQPDARAIAGKLLGAVKAALNMVDGDGFPPDWDWLREVVREAETAGIVGE